MFLWPSSELRTARRGCVGCALPLVVCIVLLLDPFHIILGLRWGRDPFDRATWQANSLAIWQTQQHAPPLNPRGRMTYSLLRQHRLVGMTRPEVLDLLGPPEHRLDSLSWWQPGDKVWVYYLGMYSFGVDEDILVLRFGTSATVADCYVDTS
jgi:hypothetical protein